MPRLPFMPRAALLPALLSLAACAPAKAQISFYTAIDLALRNSHEVKMAAADVERAAAGLSQTKDAYLPSVSVGSSIGYSYGFPVGQPSIYNVNANSLALSFSQPFLVRSARAALEGARAALKDTRDKVVAQAALAYIELDMCQRELTALDQQHEFGQRLVDIEQQRSAAGLSSAMEVTQSELTNAQLELRRLHLQDHISLLRLRLADLTGLTENGVTPESASIPGMPTPPPTNTLSGLSAQTAAITAADAEAKSKQFVADADTHRRLRPEIAFGIQYSRYAKFNNYAQYYLRFQHNNFDVGINMTFPLYDPFVKAKARASAADAVHAREQADLFRLQLAEQTRELSGGLDELRAQQKVARLQDEFAQENVDAVLTQLQIGSGNQNATPLTPRDEQRARVEERRRYVDKLECDFQLMQAQIQLERTLGGIEDWAMQAPHQ